MNLTSSSRTCFGEQCGLRLDKSTSAPSFPPLVLDVTKQRVCSICASLSVSNFSTLCAGTHVEEGNETGKKCLQHL